MNVGPGGTGVNLSLKVPSRRVPHQLPPPPADFTGRAADLAALRAKLNTGVGIIAGLTGQGGVGKTALALMLAHELVELYPDGQININLRGADPEPLTPAQVMAEVIHAFEPDARLPDDQQARAGLYQSTLYGQRVLLLLDNAHERAQVEPLVPPRGCLLLVTSRRHFVLPGIYTRRLGTLGPDEAVELIRNILPTIEQAQAAELAKACGYLPLALRVAARTLAERVNMSCTRYVERLRTSQERLTEVDAVLKESLELLDEPTRVLCTQLSIFLADFDAVAGAAVGNVDTEAAEPLLGSLVQWSLLEYNQATRRYNLHDVTRDYLQPRLDAAERRAAERRHAEHFLKLAYAADDMYSRGGPSLLEGIALFDQEWSNLSAAQAWAARNMANDDAAAFVCSTLPAAAAGYMCQLQRRPPSEQINWIKFAIAAARRMKNLEHLESHYVHLGVAHATIGNWDKASWLYRQALNLSRQDGNRKNEGAILSNLGYVRLRSGKPKQAAVLCCKAVQIAREVDNHADESNALGNLGIAFADLGDETNAILCCERALAIAQESGDHVSESVAGSNLAKMYDRLGKMSQAVELRLRTVATVRSLGNRRHEAEVLVDLAGTYLDQGAAREASEYLRQALQLSREIGHCAVEVRALVNLAALYLSAGELDEFFEYCEKALDIATEIGDRTTQALIIGNMGVVFNRARKWPAAIDAFSEAIAVVATVDQIDPRTPVELLWNLGGAYEGQGELSKAVECYASVLNSTREMGAVVMEMNANRALGLAYEKLGDLRRAVEAMQLWVTFATNVNHPDAEADAAHLNELRIRWVAQDCEVAPHQRSE